MNDRWSYSCTSCDAQEINTGTQHCSSHQAVGLENYCREMRVSEGGNCKESGGRAGGGTDGRFGKYNDSKFILDYANNYSTDIMREFVSCIQKNIDNFRARMINCDVFNTTYYQRRIKISRISATYLYSPHGPYVLIYSNEYFN